MAFNSIAFAIFLSAVVPLYFALGHRRQNHMLLVASYVFYGSWDWRFLSLILVSTLVNYLVGGALRHASDRQRRLRLVSFAMVSNLGILGFFKYFNFFADSLSELMSSLGVSTNWTLFEIVLPVGISFYTFQTMSYTIDVYRGRMEATRSFFDFALFVAFFPQLVAGPIERARDLLPSISNPRHPSLEQATRGAYLILFGLFKKIVIADGLAPSVNAIFGASAGLSGTDIWLSSVLFAFQIYCDFSGYSDIARGVSKILGFNLHQNFNQPYFSSSPREFWRRWHMSLSNWLRDYLYISLGGSQKGEGRTYRNLIVTMMLGGLWHGAAWNFVLWGLYQGFLLCVHRAWAQRYPARVGLGRQALKIGVLFLFTCYGWMLFRAESFAQISEFTRLMLTDYSLINFQASRPSLSTLLGLPLLVLLDTLHYLGDSPRFYRAWPAAARGLLYATLLVLIFMGLTNAPAEFIYFQF